MHWIVFFLVHWENDISISFHIEWDMIVVTVFLSILNQMEIYLVQSRKGNCHHNHIPFNVKGNENIIFFSVQDYTILFSWVDMIELQFALIIVRENVHNNSFFVQNLIAGWKSSSLTKSWIITLLVHDVIFILFLLNYARHARLITPKTW